jgi:hypothetical protein
MPRIISILLALLERRWYLAATNNLARRTFDVER